MYVATVMQRCPRELVDALVQVRGHAPGLEQFFLKGLIRDLLDEGAGSCAILVVCKEVAQFMPASVAIAIFGVGILSRYPEHWPSC